MIIHHIPTSHSFARQSITSLKTDAVPCTSNQTFEVVGGVISPIVKKGTAYGSSASDIFVTAYNNQTEMKFKLYEGLRCKIAKANKFIDEFTVSGIPSRLAGEVQVVVTMTVGRSDGLIHVTAESIGVATKSLTVKRDSTRYSPEEIYRMQLAALSQAGDDEQEAARMREHGNLERLYSNVIDYLNRESRAERILGSWECERIKRDAKEKLESLRLDDVRTGDLSRAKEEYQRKLRACFDGGLPIFLQ